MKEVRSAISSVVLAVYLRSHIYYISYLFFMKRGLTILRTLTIGKVHNGVRNIKFTFSVLCF